MRLNNTEHRMAAKRRGTVAAALMALTLTFGGCTVYHPQAVDIPLINHSGDARIDASAGLSFWLLPDAVTLNLTGTYGFNNWLAGQAHVNYGGDNMYAQLAPGAYLRLGEHSVLEGYAGMGYGSTWRDNITESSTAEEGESTSGTYSLKGSYMLPFVQANLGWHDLTGANFDIGFGLKAGGYLPDITYTRLDKEGNEVADSREHYESPNFLLEPQMMLRLGSQKVKFNVKLGFTVLSDVSGDPGHFMYDWFTASAGITIAL